MLHRAAPLGAPPSFASLAQVSQRVCAHFVIAEPCTWISAAESSPACGGSALSLVYHLVAMAVYIYIVHIYISIAFILFV